MEKLEWLLTGEMSRRDECNLIRPSSKMSGKVFPEKNAAVDNSGNDGISKLLRTQVSTCLLEKSEISAKTTE